MIFPKLYPKIEIKEKSNEQRIKELEDMVNLLMKEKMVNVYFFCLQESQFLTGLVGNICLNTIFF